MWLGRVDFDLEKHLNTMLVFIINTLRGTMKKIAAILAIALLPIAAHAADCYGSGHYRQCYDYDSGNSYDTLRSGNLSITNGYNAGTGSTWSQDTHHYGNMSMTDGIDSNGRSWNTTTIHHGNFSTTSGFDSDGNYYSYTCDRYGCR